MPNTHEQRTTFAAVGLILSLQLTGMLFLRRTNTISTATQPATTAEGSASRVPGVSPTEDGRSSLTAASKTKDGVTARCVDKAAISPYMKLLLLQTLAAHIFMLYQRLAQLVSIRAHQK